ncbi:MAG: hypothetical protein J5938_01655 [Clostridia bacterium]|nr:hypothetical protein [Clostridia bacterium]
MRKRNGLARRAFCAVFCALFLLAAMTACGNGERVTESGWNAALDISVFENSRMTFEDRSSDLMSGTHIVISLTKDAVREEISEIKNGEPELAGEVFYGTGSEGVTWYYSRNKETDAWEKQDCALLADEDFTVATVLNQMVAQFSGYFSHLYDAFAYDADSGCYKRVTDTCIYSISFRDGKIASAKLSFYDDNGLKEVATLTIEAYGEVSVTLPDAVIVIPEDETVQDEVPDDEDEPDDEPKSEETGE